MAIIHSNPTWENERLKQSISPRKKSELILLKMRQSLIK